MEWYPPMGTIGQELRTFLFLFFFLIFGSGQIASSRSCGLPGPVVARTSDAIK